MFAESCWKARESEGKEREILTWAEKPVFGYNGGGEIGVEEIREALHLSDVSLLLL